MTVETHPPIREVILERLYLVPLVLIDADKRKILDETGNTILDEDGNPIMDDKD